MDFAVPSHHRVKLKKGEKRDKYLDVARKLKNLRNMKLTVIPIVFGALVMISKRLSKGQEDLEIREQVKAFQTTILLRSARILSRVRETWGALLLHKLKWKTISWRWCENSQKSKRVIIILKGRGSRERIYRQSLSNKKEVEYSPGLWSAWIQHYKNSKNKSRIAISDWLQQPVRVITTDKKIWKTKNGKTNNFTVISSAELKALHMRWWGHGYEEEIWREKPNFS